MPLALAIQPGDCLLQSGLDQVVYIYMDIMHHIFPGAGYGLEQAT